MGPIEPTLSGVATESNIPKAKARAPSVPLWTTGFTLLCFTVLLGYAHNSLLGPVIPLYVKEQGGSAFFAGLVLMAFSVPSFMVRPLLGYLADAWSAAGVLALGLAFLAVGGLFFLPPILTVMFVASIFRGLGWAGLNTGAYTVLAGVAPETRRGEASGYYSGITSSASVFFPALGLWLIDSSLGGFALVFVLSSVVAAAGLPMAYLVGRKAGIERARVEKSVKGSPGGGLSGMLDKGVLLATSLNLCSTMASPAIFAFLPLYAKELGIDNVGFYYVGAGITSILIRPILGRKSDTLGRGPSIAAGFTAQLIGMLLLMVAQNLPMLILGGVFNAFGFALNGSATAALAMDLANPERRGKSMATFSISFQLGSGIGALVAGGLADLVGYRGMYAGSATIIALGYVVLLFSWRLLPKPHRETVPT